MDETQPDEETRLLGPNHTVSEPAATQDRPSAFRTILSAAAVLLILNIGSHITFAPQTAILQDIVCAKYYADNAVLPFPPPSQGDRCKIEPVQSEVAHINAWKDVFEALPGIILTVPYGTLADRIGRKKILLLATLGCLMNDVWIRIVYWFSDVFPVRAVWFGGLWQVLGAGAATFSSLSFVLVADVCPAEQRTAAFAQIQAATLLSRLIFVPLGGALISKSPWIPMTIGLIAMITGFFAAVAFVPETLAPPSSPPSRNQEAGTLDNLNAQKGFRGPVRDFLESSVLLCRWMTRNSRVVVLLSSFLVFHLGEQADALLMLQYVARRLGWTIGEASYITSLGAAANLVVLILLIPFLSTFLIRRLNLHELAKDKSIAQLSALLLIIGSATVAIATSWILLVLGQVLFSLGYAFAVPTRSLVTGMVEQKHLGTLYTVISVLTYTGMITGEPVFAAVFRWGMRTGEAWIGMPFLMAAGCFGLAFLAVTVTPMRAGENDVEYTSVGQEYVPEQSDAVFDEDR